MLSSCLVWTSWPLGKLELPGREVRAEGLQFSEDVELILKPMESLEEGAGAAARDGLRFLLLKSEAKSIGT